MPNYEFTGPVSFGGYKAINLAAPTAGTDGVNKTYADALRGVMLTAGSVGARPASPLTGQQIYRTDKGFVEQWDGGAWRVPHGQVVAALTDITNPVTGQFAILSTDNYRMYYYDGQWLLYGAAQRIGGEWAASAQQNLAVGANKLTFPTALMTAQGITFNGTDTWTIQSDGSYEFDVQFRTSAAVAGGVAISGTTYSDGTLLIGPRITAQGNWGDVGNTGRRWLTAGTQICAYFYSITATSTAFATRPPRITIWKALSH